MSSVPKPVKAGSPLKLIISVVLISAGFSGIYSYWKIKQEEKKLERFATFLWGQKIVNTVFFLLNFLPGPVYVYVNVYVIS